MADISRGPMSTMGKVVSAVLLLMVAGYGYVVWGISRGRAYMDAPLAPPVQRYRLIVDEPPSSSPCASRKAGGTLEFSADSRWVLRDSSIMCVDGVARAALGAFGGRYHMENGRYVLEGPPFARELDYGTAVVVRDTLRLPGNHFGIRPRVYLRSAGDSSVRH